MQKDKKHSQNSKHDLEDSKNIAIDLERAKIIDIDGNEIQMNTYVRKIESTRIDVMEYLREHPEKFAEIQDEIWKKKTNPSRRDKRV